MLSERERPMRSLLIGVGLVILAAFLAAIGASKLYWGYYLRRPGLDRRLHQIERVLSLTAVRSEPRPDGALGLVPDEPYRIYDDIGACYDEEQSRAYYCLRGRALVALAERGMLPAVPDRLPPEELESLYDLLAATGKLVQGAPGYDHAEHVRGIVLEAVDGNGLRYLFVAASGRQVSNDHYPYYEFLFRVAEPGAGLRLLSYRRFFYDVAGIEGVEWPVAFVALSLAGTVLLVFVWGIRAVIDAYRGKHALQMVAAVAVLVLPIVLMLALGLGAAGFEGR